MNQRRLNFVFSCLSLALLLTAAGCGSSTVQLETSTTPDLSLPAEQFTSTATPIPSTNTPTFEPTETPTATATGTVTHTMTSTATDTPEPLILTLKQDSVCMAGASFNHQVAFYVNIGTPYPLLGTVVDHSWWLIESEDDRSCWISASVASIQGDVASLPILTPPPIPSLTPTVTPQVPGIYYILIAKDTGGPIGCGDSLVKYYPGVWVKGDLEDDILGALNALFSNHNQFVNGFYNPMYQSDLRAKSVDIVGNDVVIQLGGTLVRPKDNCESQRMRAQVWYTVSQFSPTRAVIYLNKALLGDLLVVAK